MKDLPRSEMEHYGDFSYSEVTLRIGFRDEHSAAIFMVRHFFYNTTRRLIPEVSTFHSHH
jgi:hypothetical protein